MALEFSEYKILLLLSNQNSLIWEIYVDIFKEFFEKVYLTYAKPSSVIKTGFTYSAFKISQFLFYAAQLKRNHQYSHLAQIFIFASSIFIVSYHHIRHIYYII